MSPDTLSPITSITPSNFAGRDLTSGRRQDLGLNTQNQQQGSAQSDTPEIEGFSQSTDGDSISLSPEASHRAREFEQGTENRLGLPQDQSSKNNVAPAERDTEANDVEEIERDQETDDELELTEEELEMIEELKRRDLEVRTHEQAHLAAAGDLAIGGPTYEYQRGPDGKRYAVGGQVNIDVSEVPNDPEATVVKAGRIKRAALAPAEPSAQDRRIASRADAMKSSAQAEIRQEALEGSDTDDSSGNDAGPSTDPSSTSNTAQANPSAQNDTPRPFFAGDENQGSDETFARRAQPFVSPTEPQSSFSVIA